MAILSLPTLLIPDLNVHVYRAFDPLDVFEIHDLWRRGLS